LAKGGKERTCYPLRIWGGGKALSEEKSLIAGEGRGGGNRKQEKGGVGKGECDSFASCIRPKSFRNQGKRGEKGKKRNIYIFRGKEKTYY